MVGVKALAKLGATTLTAATGPPGEHAFLKTIESPFHLLTQYSVNCTSRTGRLAGGCKTACRLILTAAAA